MGDPSTDETALATRDGLPEALRRLCAKYPRDNWATHPNLGEWARFWLDRHNMFRDLGAALEDACEKARAGEVGRDDFTAWFAPRLQFFLGHLDLHHRIEEAHIFPAFARAEPALAQGFALLEADHRAIHVLTDALQAPAGEAAEFHEALAALRRALAAHLDDEEDLIVPIVLDRGEAAIGLY